MANISGLYILIVHLAIDNSHLTAIRKFQLLFTNRAFIPAGAVLLQWNNRIYIIIFRQRRFRSLYLLRLQPEPFIHAGTKQFLVIHLAIVANISVLYAFIIHLAIYHLNGTALSTFQYLAATRALKAVPFPDKIYHWVVFLNNRFRGLFLLI